MQFCVAHTPANRIKYRSTQAQLSVEIPCLIAEAYFTETVEAIAQIYSYFGLTQFVIGERISLFIEFEDPRAGVTMRRDKPPAQRSERPVQLAAQTVGVS